MKFFKAAQRPARSQAPPQPPRPKRKRKILRQSLSPLEVVRSLRTQTLGTFRRPIPFAEVLLRFAGLGTDGRLVQNYGARAMAMGISLAILSGFVLFRYAYLSLLPNDLRERLRTQATRQFESEIKLAPPRAPIVDRNGRTLAVSLLQPSLFVVPKRIPKDGPMRARIARQLGVSADTLEELSRSKKSFAWLRRKISTQELAKVGDLSQWHDFVGVVDEPKRVYPEKELASHLIGFVGLDNIGLEGVEGIYNTQLNGDSVTAKVTRDARGHVTLVTPNGAVRPEPSLPPLKLSIDVSVQGFAESALREGVLKAEARGGSAVVMDIDSGELLAIASYPTYDLNDPPEGHPERRRFRPVMDALELGSVVKPIFVAKALDMGLVRKDDSIFCENGSLPVPGGRIRDDHPHGWITIGEVIKYSSNICTYKLMQKLGRQAFYETVIRSGLGTYSGSGLPGEWAGRISQPQSWREMRFANMAFGQGLAISPLQLTRAIATITGGGTDRSVRILARDDNETEQAGPPAQYISSQTSRVITEMMKSVVEEDGGTGKKASVPGVNVAGKTGTAQKFNSVTKSYSERISSFVGVLPAERPKLAITVVIDEPKVRPAYGGLLAGPVFSEIGSKTIQYLNALGVLAIDADVGSIEGTLPMARSESLQQSPE